MPISDPKISVCVTIRKSLHEEASAYAKANERSVSWVVNTALQEWLSRSESTTQPTAHDTSILLIED